MVGMAMVSMATVSIATVTMAIVGTATVSMATVGRATVGIATVMVTWWDKSAFHGALGLLHNVLENLPLPLSYQCHRSGENEETESNSSLSYCTTPVWSYLPLLPARAVLPTR